MNTKIKLFAATLAISVSLSAAQWGHYEIVDVTSQFKAISALPVTDKDQVVTVTRGGYKDGKDAQFKGISDAVRYGDYLYLTDSDNSAIRRVDLTTQNVVTVVGEKQVSGKPMGITSDQNGNLYFTHDNQISMIDKSVHSHIKSSEKDGIIILDGNSPDRIIILDGKTNSNPQNILIQESIVVQGGKTNSKPNGIIILDGSNPNGIIIQEGIIILDGKTNSDPNGIIILDGLTWQEPNLFATDTNGNVYKMSNSNGAWSQSVIAKGLQGVRSIATDNNGNIYVDQGNSLKKLTFAQPTTREKFNYYLSSFGTRAYEVAGKVRDVFNFFSGALYSKITGKTE